MELLIPDSLKCGLRDYVDGSGRSVHINVYKSMNQPLIYGHLDIPYSGHHAKSQ